MLKRYNLPVDIYARGSEVRNTMTEFFLELLYLDGECQPLTLLMISVVFVVMFSDFQIIYLPVMCS